MKEDLGIGGEVGRTRRCEMGGVGMDGIMVEEIGEEVGMSRKEGEEEEEIGGMVGRQEAQGGCSA